MTYDEKTMKAECDRCKHQWQTRGQKPSRCPKCSAYAWDSGTRKYEALICRVNGTEPETGRLELSIIPYVDHPGFQTDDICYLTKEDQAAYMFNRRHPIGSALVMVGTMELQENLELKIQEMRLIYCHEANLQTYISTPYLFYNIKSFHERKKQLAKYEEQLRQKEIAEAEARDLKIEAARIKLEKEAKLKGQVLEAEAVISSAAATTEDKLKAIAFLEKVKL